MNIALVVIAVIVIVAGAFTSRNGLANQPENIETKPESTPAPSPTVKPVVTVVATPSPTDTPTSEPKRVEINSGWAYPNSRVISEGGTLVLMSGDNTDAITDWYKNKIESGGYNVKSFIKTSANDVIKNVINAAGNGSVNVEITKDGSSEARIEVEVSS